MARAELNHFALYRKSGVEGELLGVKSPSEFIELSTAQMRKQFDMFSAQNKELCALTQEVGTEAAEPIKIGVSKAFNKAP